MPHKPTDRALVWLRRDLRLEDHAALSLALRSAQQVWCCFVFDRGILDPLPRQDRRVTFIHDSLVQLDAALQALAHSCGTSGAGLIVRHGHAAAEIASLAQLLKVKTVYASHDDEPQSLARDTQARTLLAASGVHLHTVKDHVVFERSEVLTQTGTPFSVFTPYKNAWLKRLTNADLAPHAVQPHAHGLAARPATETGPTGPNTLKALGFDPTPMPVANGLEGAQSLLQDFLPRLAAYDQTRDFPAIKGPSYLGPHLRFGTVSTRALARLGLERMPAGESGAQTWLSELIWRDFYHQVLHHHPHVATQAFKPAYDRIIWASGAVAQGLFSAWCEGRTGYPLVDAAMAQINQTGYMHNRLRMVVASFLTKDLGLDWRLGEAYFALHLNDFDLAANNGGWQWAASSGCDAQPYFRIFNPVSQSERFDAEGKFIRRYLPQLAKLPNKLIHAPWLARPVDLAAAGVRLGHHYPLPVVDHAAAREITLKRYAVVKTV